MARASSFERSRNFTRISTENIIQVDSEVRLTRRGSRDMATSAEVAPARRNAGETASTSTGRSHARQSSRDTTRTTPQSSEDRLPRSAGQTSVPQQQRRGSADISAENILDSPSAPRQTRRGAAIRSISTRQAERHDPMTRKGRTAPKQSGSTTGRKRVQFAVPITRSEAHDLLEQGRRMSEEVTADDVPRASEVFEEMAVEDIPIPQDASTQQEPETSTVPQDSPLLQEPDIADEYALYEEAASAVEEALDPIVAVIQRLALRAASDPELRALMRIVASGRASRDQLYELQHHINEIDEADDDIGASTPPTAGVAALAVEEDSSSESELDDKENVPPASSQALGFRGSSNRDYMVDRGGSQPRSALRILPVITPSPLAQPVPHIQASSRAPRESEASLNNRVRNSVHLQNAQRLRREAERGIERPQQNEAPSANQNRERSLHNQRTSATAASPTVTGLGALADFLPSPTPPRRSGPG
ncbi:MAG: hypothetical protein Q9184_005560 [Pyrenodesmia sp. 2 TL-2023]